MISASPSLKSSGNICLDAPRDAEELWTVLGAARVCSERQLLTLWPECSTLAPQAILERLVAEEILTTYQADQILQGRASRLVLGQYLLLEELGRGGFGQVFKAMHTVMRRVVAIKLISPHLLENESARAWFRREMLAATPLHHPNVVMAHDANEVDGVLFLVMEYVPGLNLDAFVGEHGPLPWDMALEITRQAALGLQHAHEKGMVHRDIKPANLLIIPEVLGNPERARKEPFLKVVDFGLARLSPAGQPNTIVLQNERSLVGTPDFISPEQAGDVHAADIRSDLYSLGCTLYFALTSRKPFQSSTALEVITKQMNKEAAPMSRYRTDLPPELEQIVRTLMRKDPKQRFQTPAQLLEEIDRCRWNGCLAYVGLGGGWTGPPDATDVPATAVLPAIEANGALEPTARKDACPGSPPSQTPPSSGDVQAERVAVHPNPPEPDALRTPGAANSALEALKQCWRSWRRVIDGVSNRRLSADMTEQAYGDLYRKLLACCRGSKHALSPEQQQTFRRVESLVEPWVSLRTLAAMEAHAIDSLLVACLRLDRELGQTGRSGVTWFLLLILIVFCAGFALFWVR